MLSDEIKELLNERNQKHYGWKQVGQQVSAKRDIRVNLTGSTAKHVDILVSPDGSWTGPFAKDISKLLKQKTDIAFIQEAILFDTRVKANKRSKSFEPVVPEVVKVAVPRQEIVKIFVTAQEVVKAVAVNTAASNLRKEFDAIPWKLENSSRVPGTKIYKKTFRGQDCFIAANTQKGRTDYYYKFNRLFENDSFECDSVEEAIRRILNRVQVLGIK